MMKAEIHHMILKSAEGVRSKATETAPKRLGGLERVATLVELGCVDRNRIAGVTGLPINSVDAHLCWLRKTRFDVDKASKLRSQASMRSKLKKNPLGTAAA